VERCLEVMDWQVPGAEVGPGAFCLPLHPPHVKPSCIDYMASNDVGEVSGGAGSPLTVHWFTVE
jgi:hypothetical protein